MARFLAACLLAVPLCVGALIANASGDDLDFSLFAPTPAVGQAPLNFSLFAAEPAEHTALKFSLFDPAASDEAAKPRRKQVLYFTAKWCVSCKRTQKTIDALKAAGWDVGEHETAAIRIVDIDEHHDLKKAHLVYAVPTWVSLRDGKEVEKFGGFLDPYQVARLYRESHLNVASR